MSACDGQTDGRTDGHPDRSQYRACIAELRWRPVKMFYCAIDHCWCSQQCNVLRSVNPLTPLLPASQISSGFACSEPSHSWMLNWTPSRTESTDKRLWIGLPLSLWLCFLLCSQQVAPVDWSHSHKEQSENNACAAPSRSAAANSERSLILAIVGNGRE